MEGTHKASFVVTTARGSQDPSQEGMDTSAVPDIGVPFDGFLNLDVCSPNHQPKRATHATYRKNRLARNGYSS